VGQMSGYARHHHSPLGSWHPFCFVLVPARSTGFAFFDRKKGQMIRMGATQEAAIYSARNAVIGSV
jgi:hypothetical protein